MHVQLYMHVRFGLVHVGHVHVNDLSAMPSPINAPDICAVEP